MEDTGPQINYTPVIAVAAFLGLAFDYLFYGHVPGVSFPVWIGLILLGLLVLAKRYQVDIPFDLLFLVVPTMFFSLMVAVRAGEFLTLMNIGMSFYLLILITERVLGKNIAAYHFFDYLKPLILLPLNSLDKFIVTFSAVLAAGQSDEGRKTLRQVVRGMLIALPILLLFLLLLSSADLIFQKYVSGLLDYFTPELIFRGVLVFTIAAFFVGAYTYVLLKRGNVFQVGGERKSAGIGMIEGSIVVGSINALFLAFILIQITYLFGGRTNIGVGGATYAQYARKGFFELLAVAAISFLVIWIAEKYVTRKSAVESFVFKSLSCLLVIEVMVIMASALKRLLMYENAYGFTALRFYSHAFIFWLAVVFIFLAIKIIRDEREGQFLVTAFVWAVVFLALVDLANPDAFIARQNLARYRQSGKLDTWYLSSLSSDALPETLTILDSKDVERVKDFTAGLHWRWESGQKWDTSWQSFNLAERQGRRLLKPHAKLMKQNRDRRPPAYPFGHD